MNKKLQKEEALRFWNTISSLQISFISTDVPARSREQIYGQVQ